MPIKTAIACLACSLLFAAHAGAAPPLAEDELMVVKPEGMADRVSLTAKPSFCPASFSGENWETGRLRRAVGSREAYDLWADAAERICQYTDDPRWLKQLAYLIQNWMNVRNLSQADAEAEIGRKIAKLKVERANEGREPTDEERFAFRDNELEEVKPADGVAAARIEGRPAWCDKAVLTEKWETGRIHRSVIGKYGISGLIDGALHICQRPTEPTWRTQAGYILQQWMNWTRLDQAGAEASLRARIQQQKFAADRESLCKGLDFSPEAAGAAKAFAVAQQRFFGCGSDAALWLDQAGTKDDVGFYLDVASAAGPEAELMRLYWLFHLVETPWHDHPLPSKEASENRSLLYYAIAQHDFAHIDRAALDQLLASQPYNDYARTIVLESLSLLKARQKSYEQAIEKLSKGDEDYVNILREAPKRAFAQWEQAALQWKGEIARSDAFERKLSAPSHKALKGCSAELQKDAEKLIRSLKEHSYDGLRDKIAADPVAVLLLSRLAVCDATDGIQGASGALRDLVKHARDLRGPRSLAYYAVLDALALAIKDRPRLLLSLGNLWYHSPSLIDELRGELSFDGGAPADPEKSFNKGFVAAVAKVADGLQITFKPQKLTFPDYSCTDDTRHPLKINSDGRIEYYRNCKATGKMLVQDNTPRPVVIAPSLNAGVKPGAFLVFAETGARSKSGNPFGIVVYTKKTATEKTILTFFGFNLESH